MIGIPRVRLFTTAANWPIANLKKLLHHFELARQRRERATARVHFKRARLQHALFLVVVERERIGRQGELDDFFCARLDPRTTRGDRDVQFRHRRRP